jgi:NADPH:quinone reductase-like Zn-dependent oxidoreductase
VRRGGVYAALGGDSAAWFALALLEGPALSLASQRSMGMVLHWKPFEPGDVAALAAFVASGQLRPFIDRRYPFAELVDALRYVDEGHARGKVVITM